MRNTLRQCLCAAAALLFGLGVSSAAAQQTVTGRVTSAETLQPLSGVLVSVQGSNVAVLTNADGRYSVNAPADGTLTFSLIGFTQQSVPVQNRTTIDVNLQPTALALDELLVVGYTTQTRRSIAGAVSTVQAGQISDRQVVTVQDALKGRVAGVNVRNSGQPGQSAVVDIRGRAFTADNDPLYVVDGMYLNDLRNLNPNDIESIQVLKDASAASQYGARAANGVVVITTRQGRASDGNRITLSSNYGYQEIPRLIPMMNSREWAELYEEKYSNSRALDPTSPTPPAGVLEVFNGTNTYDTNWQEEVTQPGYTTDHVLAVSGGTQSGDATYYVSGGYLRQKGTLIDTDFERYTLRVNSQLRRGRLTLGENLMLSRSDRNNPTAPGGALGSALSMFPSIPILNDGRFGPPEAVYGIGTANYPTFANNPVGGSLLNSNIEQRNELIGTVFGQVDLFEGLAYRLQVGIRYNDDKGENFSRAQMIRQNTGPFPANLTISSDLRNTLLLEHLLTFNRAFGPHAFNVTGGFTQERNERNNLSARRANFQSEDIRVLPGGTEEISNNQVRTESRLNSFLGRASYTLLDRYIVEANFRRDGSSRFGPLNRWGNFWSGALGWVVSDEAFFQDIPLVGGADFMKLRASYGTQGNQDFADYEWQATVVQQQGAGEGGSGCCFYLFGPGEGTVTPGLAAVNLSNPSIRWQDNTTMNIGIDLGLLDNRLSITGEYYVSESDGVLARVPLIPSIGSFESPFFNVGAIRNSGFEFAIQHTYNRTGFELTTGLNLTTLNNEVLRLGGSDEAIITGASRTAVGEPLGHFWLMETCGIFNTQEEINAHGVQPNARPGDLCFVDHNGDGQITQDGDKHYAGSPWPKLEGGLFFDGRMNRFDFRIGLRGAFGQKAYNGVRPGLENTNGDSNAPKWLDPWREDDHNANAPKAYWGGLGADNARGPNDRFLEDNSYVKLQNIMLGYSVPTTFLSSAGLQIESARIYVNLQDIHTFTDYLGYDPEFRGGALNPGEDGGGTYPNPRTISIGLDLGI